jgi:hypothetical protein
VILEGPNPVPRAEAEGAFLVLEIMPEFPLLPPHVGEQITAWGVVRHDGLHNWWELHPLVGWRGGGRRWASGDRIRVERLAPGSQRRSSVTSLLQLSLQAPAGASGS